MIFRFPQPGAAAGWWLAADAADAAAQCSCRRSGRQRFRLPESEEWIAPDHGLLALMQDTQVPYDVSSFTMDRSPGKHFPIDNWPALRISFSEVTMVPR